MKITEIKKGDRFKCIQTVKMLDSGHISYLHGKEYTSLYDGNITDEENECWHWWSDIENVNRFFIKADQQPNQMTNEIKTPEYYDNSNGSLYKIAGQRKWCAYTFDVVKRLDRAGKKDPLKQEIEKSIAVLQLWLKELES